MDYQAFGEQIASSIGQRTTTGYAATDTLRNRYALTERDEATGLDDTWFRKLENRGGRWTSPDPYNGSANIGNGQSWNRYSYVENQPTNFVDPSGLNMAILIPNIECRTVIRLDRPETVCEQVGWRVWEVGGGGVDSPSGGSTTIDSAEATNTPQSDDANPCVAAALARFEERMKKAQDARAKVNTNITFGDTTTVVAGTFIGLVFGNGSPVGAGLGAAGGFGFAKLSKFIDRDVPYFFAKYFDDVLVGEVKRCGSSGRRR